MTLNTADQQIARANRRQGRWIDAGFRLAYRTAYNLARLWWFVRRPLVTGSNAAIWHGNQLLLLKSSYRPGWQFPGGFKHKAEDPCTAARRETMEEIGVALSPGQMRGPIVVESRYEYRRELNYIFEISLEAPLDPTVDNREIVATAYFTAEEIARRIVTPTVRLYLEQRSRLDNNFGLAADSV